MSLHSLADLIVEVAFTSAVDDLTPAWVDVTDRVLSLSTRRGRSDELSVIEPGTASILFDDTDGFFDRDQGGIYDASIRPNRKVRVGVQAVAGTTIWLWQGYSDSWTRTWPGGGGFSTTQLDCTDRFKLLAVRTHVTDIVRGSAETASHRIIALLDNNGQPADNNERAINVNGYASRTLQPYTYETTGSILSNLNDAAFSDGGQLFMSTDGKVTFQTHAYRTSHGRSTSSQATFSNSRTAAIEIDAGFSKVVSDVTLANYVRVTDFEGVVQVAADTTAIFNDGPVFLDGGNTMLAAADAQARANQILAIRSEPRPYYPALTVDLGANASAVATVCDLEISDLVTVEVIPAGASQGFSRQQFIEAVEHQMDLRTGEWLVTLALSAGAGSSTVIYP